MALPFQLASAVVLILCAFANSPVRAADCVDVSAIESLSLSGRLANRTYPDTEAPLRDDNREATESAYILQLDSPGYFRFETKTGAACRGKFCGNHEPDPAYSTDFKDRGGERVLRFGGERSVFGHSRF